MVSAAIWGDGVHWTALSKRFVALLPLLLAAAVAVTAVIAAVRWRSAKPPPSVTMSISEGWLELPEAPLLRLRKSDVAVIRTARNYCELEVAGRLILVRVTAKQLEDRLAPLGFVRVHRGAIVNLSRVRMVQRARSGCLRLLLDDGSEIGVSRGHRDAFAHRLSATTRMPFHEDWAA
jgi:DNA-binding LytR/AlgR family response regulator